jgi:hypothetical protein
MMSFWMRGTFSAGALTPKSPGDHDRVTQFGDGFEMGHRRGLFDLGHQARPCHPGSTHSFARIMSPGRCTKDSATQSTPAPDQRSGQRSFSVSGLAAARLHQHVTPLLDNSPPAMTRVSAASLCLAGGDFRGAGGRRRNSTLMRVAAHR